MSNAHKVILGITEDDLRRAAQAIADAIDAAGDSGTQPVDRLAVERAAHAWLGAIVESLLAQASHHALSADSVWSSMFHYRLIVELERTRKAQ